MQAGLGAEVLGGGERATSQRRAQGRSSDSDSSSRSGRTHRQKSKKKAHKKSHKERGRSQGHGGTSAAAERPDGGQGTVLDNRSNSDAGGSERTGQERTRGSDERNGQGGAEEEGATRGDGGAEAAQAAGEHTLYCCLSFVVRAAGWPEHGGALKYCSSFDGCQ